MATTEAPAKVPTELAPPTGDWTPGPVPTGPFVVPTKRILSKAHLAAFQRSPAHADILGFIDTLNERVVGVKLSEQGEGSEVSFEV